MSARMVIGGAMASSPLAVVLVGIYLEHGWVHVAAVLGMLAVVVTGAYLVASDL